MLIDDVVKGKGPMDRILIISGHDFRSPGKHPFHSTGAG